MNATVAAAVEARLDDYRSQLENLLPGQRKRKTDLQARVSELAWVLRLLEGSDQS